MNWVVIAGAVLVAIGTVMMVVGGHMSGQRDHKEVLAKVEQVQRDTIKVIGSMSLNTDYDRFAEGGIDNNEANRELITLVKSIQTNPDSAIVNEKFLKYINQFEKGRIEFSNIRDWHERSYANVLDRVAIICTVDQYKTQGFVAFFDLLSGKLLKIDKESYSLGIVAVKYYDIDTDYLDYLFAVKYLSNTGTGVKMHAVKIYSIKDDEINIALEKPYSAILTADWQAFSSDVEFEQKNIVNITDGIVNIRTVGRVIYYKNTTEEEISIDLPEEEYIWNKNEKKFEQTAGREVSKDLDLPSIYADYADPKGNWFEKSDDIIKGEFVPESW